MSYLQGFQSIDVCAAVSPPGVPMLEYAALADLNLGDLEAAVDANYNQQDTVSFSSGSWLSLPIIPGSGTWQEETQSTDQGTYFNVSVGGVLGADTPAVRAEIDRMKQHRFLLRVPDRAGSRALVGWPEQPAVMEARFESGAGAGDTRGWRITFRATQLWPSPNYQPVF